MIDGVPNGKQANLIIRSTHSISLDLIKKLESGIPNLGAILYLHTRPFESIRIGAFLHAAADGGVQPIISTFFTIVFERQVWEEAFGFRHAATALSMRSQTSDVIWTKQ